MLKKIILLVFIFLPACVGVPEGITPVDGFNINRYLGKWYEIARLDHSFERGLENVTADYSLREDGGIDVVNRGYNTKEKEWKQAKGKAYFVGKSKAGLLKVSFFGPFYGGYNIITLDKEEYAYSMVCGPDRSYLWILSRIPEMDRQLLKELIDQAAKMGFDTETLIFVNQKTIIE